MPTKQRAKSTPASRGADSDASGDSRGSSLPPCPVTAIEPSTRAERWRDAVLVARAEAKSLLFHASLCRQGLVDSKSMGLAKDDLRVALDALGSLGCTEHKDLFGLLARDETEQLRARLLKLNENTPPANVASLDEAVQSPLTDLQLTIMAQLKGNAYVGEKLAIAIGNPYPTVRDALGKLKELGKVNNKLGLGYYRPDFPPPQE